jgi:hypothetical protein
MHWSVSEVLFKCVVENDVQGVHTYIESGEDVNAQNEEVPLLALFILVAVRYCCIVFDVFRV